MATGPQSGGRDQEVLSLTSVLGRKIGTEYTNYHWIYAVEFSIPSQSILKYSTCVGFSLFEWNERKNSLHTSTVLLNPVELQKALILDCVYTFQKEHSWSTTRCKSNYNFISHDWNPCFSSVFFHLRANCILSYKNRFSFCFITSNCEDSQYIVVQWKTIAKHQWASLWSGIPKICDLDPYIRYWLLVTLSNTRLRAPV